MLKLTKMKKKFNLNALPWFDSYAVQTLSVTDPDELLSVRLAAVKNDFLWDRFGFGVDPHSFSVAGASSIFIILLKLSATFALRSWVEVSWLMCVVDMFLRLSSSNPDNWRFFLSSECFLLGWNLKEDNPDMRIVLFKILSKSFESFTLCPVLRYCFD